MKKGGARGSEGEKGESEVRGRVRENEGEREVRG